IEPKGITIKVQLVYYLCRNGQLKHTHYVELTHVSNQPLHLKDFKDRLTILRGKGMPSIYSWSCN
ncbi:Protein SOSEKI, partial [Dillenia turbinata]